MKKVITLLTVFSIIGFQSFGQEQKLEKLQSLEQGKSEKAEKEAIATIEPVSKVEAISPVHSDTVVVEVGDEIFSVRDLGDETRVKLGKKEFRIVENSDGVVVFRSKQDSDQERSREFPRRRSDRFRSHLGGLEFGFNGYMTEFGETALDPADYYMDLNTAKSNNWNFIFPAVNIGLTRHFGIAAALGLNINKYRFDGNNTIVKDQNGVIGPFIPSGIEYTRTKLVTTYATLPLILEAQIPVSGESRKTINLGAGVIGAVKLGSYAKVVYNANGKQKEKYKDDFSLNPLRMGVTARLGYEDLQVYATYYMTQMFENGKGPELYPFEIGLAFTFNN